LYGLSNMAIIAMMKTVNIAELKNRLSVYLNEVRAGKEILVRDRNLPIAKIVPLRRLPQDDGELLHLEAQGKIRLGEGPIDNAFWNLPAPRVSVEAIRKAMEWERDES
jgi:prevent-host-death family protein